MNRLWWKFVAGFVGLGMIVVVGLLLAPKDPIPPTIRKQVTSTILIPRSSDIAIDRSLVKYDAASKLMTYRITYAGKTMVVSEQPTPESFVDVPKVYERLVDGLGTYSTFDVSVGTVHLTKPKELKGKQAAVMNAKGTLLFAKPDEDLSDDEWRRLFNTFVVSAN